MGKKKDKPEKQDDGYDWHKLLKSKKGIQYPCQDPSILATFGTQLVQDFCDIFNTRVHNSPNFDKMCLHVVLGQLPSIKKMRYYIGNNAIDLRIHGCLFQPSGSTKGMGFNFVAELCKLLNMIYQVTTDFTANGLLGEPDERTIQMLKCSNCGSRAPIGTAKCSSCNTAFTTKSKKIKIKEPYIKPGVIHPDMGVNIAASNEASSIFDNSKVDHYRNSMLYMQVAMNTMNTPDNHIYRKTGVGIPIDFYPDISFLLTSYPPENLYEVIIRRGFLQRMIIVYNDTTSDQRSETMEHSNEVWNVKVSQISQLQSLADRFAYINRRYHGVHTLKVTDEVRKHMTLLTQDIVKFLKPINRAARKKLEEFAPRYNELAKTIAFHHAILRLSDTVELIDIDYAEQLILPLWKSICVLIEENLHQDPRVRTQKYNEALDIVAAYKEVRKSYEDKAKKEYAEKKLNKTEFNKRMKELNKGWVRRKDVNDELRKKWKKAQPTVDKKLNEMVEIGVFTQVRSPMRFGYMIKLARNPMYGE